MTKKLFFITTRLFWPTDSGRKLSLYYYCKGLHDRYNCDIYLYSFLEAGQSKKDLDNIPLFIKEVKLAEPIRKSVKLHNLIWNTFVARKWPIQCSLFYSDKNKKAIHDYVQNIKPDYIFVDMIRTAMYFTAFKDTKCLKVLDMDDLLSARYEKQLHSKYKSNISGQYANSMSSLANLIVNNGTVRNFILNVEKKLTRKAEILYSGLYDKVIFVSDVETSYINKIIPNKAVTIPVGINTSNVDKRVAKAEKNTLTFVGNLNVAANVDSLRWIISDILPLVKHPVRFMVIGKCPDSVRDEYKDNNHIVFTGRVVNLAEYVQKGQLFLSPLLYGTGIKTKILEAMSMGVPVVTNQVGAEGINAENGSEIMIADSEKDIAEIVDKILDNQTIAEKIADKARLLAESKYSWNKIWDKFGTIL